MTYSIVARDPETGDFGAAVQSHWFGAGDVCWAAAGVGAVATQATVLIDHGPLGLSLMRDGASAQEALRSRLEADEDREHRQMAMVDRRGDVAVHTGARCIREAGHRTGEGFSCQANMMLRDTVWDAMQATFAATSGDLATRLLATLEAAEAEGGDIRGRQAARILVVRAEATAEPWTDTLVDLRVDDHETPLAELRRLLDLQRAYRRLEEAEDVELAGETERALLERLAAFAQAPGNPEIAFWTALSLAGAGRLEEARGIVRVAFDAHPGWVELLERLVADELVELPTDAFTALVSEGRPAGDG